MQPISTLNLSEQQWLAYRQKGLGGSDVAAALGISPYKTKYKLWQEKVSSDLPEPLQNEALDMGLKLEPIVADKYMEVTGNKVVKDNKIRFHPEYDFLIANIDRIIQPIDDRGAGILEIKTTSNFAFKQWEQAIPIMYYCQIQHYLAVTGYKWAEFAILVDGRYFHRLPIERDEDYIKKQTEALVGFWKGFVEPNVAPPLTAEELAFVETKKGEAIEADKIILDSYEELLKIKAEIKSKEEEKKRLESVIKLFIEDKEVLTVNGEPVVTWKQRESTRIDSKKLLALHPDIHKEVSNTTKSRYFIVKE